VVPLHTAIRHGIVKARSDYQDELGWPTLADPGRACGLVAPDRSVMARNVLVETAADGVVEVTQNREVLLEVAARVHRATLTTITFDKLESNRL